VKMDRRAKRLRRAASPVVKRQQAWDAEHVCAKRAGAVRVESEEGRSARFIWTHLIAKSKLPMPAICIAHTLVLHGRADGSDIWPSTATLAAEANCTERCVCDQLDVLARAGYIWREPRNTGRKWAGTVYTLIAPQERLEEFTADPAPWSSSEDNTWVPDYPRTERAIVPDGTEPRSVPNRTDETSVGESVGTEPRSVPSRHADVTQGDGTERHANGTERGSDGTEPCSKMALSHAQSSLSSESVIQSVRPVCAAAQRTAGPDPSSRAITPTPSPSPKPDAVFEERIEKICRVIQAMPPETDDEHIKRCVYESTSGEVRIARRRLARKEAG